jgi:hypothetical protein
MGGRRPIWLYPDLGRSGGIGYVCTKAFILKFNFQVHFIEIKYKAISELSKEEIVVCGSSFPSHLAL